MVVEAGTVVVAESVTDPKILSRSSRPVGPRRLVRCSVVGVASLQHGRETRGLLLAPPHCARLFKPSALAEFLQGLLAIQLLLKPADGFLYGFALSQFHFSHNSDSACSAIASDRPPAPCRPG